MISPVFRVAACQDDQQDIQQGHDQEKGDGVEGFNDPVTHDAFLSMRMKNDRLFGLPTGGTIAARCRAGWFAFLGKLASVFADLCWTDKGALIGDKLARVGVII